MECTCKFEEAKKYFPESALIHHKTCPMSKINLEYRKQVQERAKKIGHCVCSKLFTCECKYFIDNNICKCAGESGNFTAKSMKDWIKYNTSDNS